MSYEDHHNTNSLVARYLKQTGKSYSDIATVLEVSPQTVNMYKEQGIPLKHLKLICIFLGIDEKEMKEARLADYGNKQDAGFL